MNKFKFFLFFAIFVLSGYNLFAQTSYTWSGGTGEWHTGSNWTPAGVPGALDTAIINSGTVSLTDNATVAKLEFSADLRGDSNLVVTNMMIWNNGPLQGTGSVSIPDGATLRLIGGNQQTLRRNLINNGTTIWEAGHFALFDGIVFDNNGSFLDQHPISENLSGGSYGCSFNNAGTYTKTGDCVSGIALPFYNNGTLNLEIGSLNLNSNGTSSGSINVADGFLLKIQGTQDISGPVSGEGTVEFWNATTIHGTYDITGSTVFANNKTTFDTNATIVSLNHGQELVITGTAEFNTGDPLEIDSLYLAGTLQGSDSVAILKSKNWASNVLQGSGGFNITAGATMRLTGGNQQTLRRNLVNNGTTIWEAGNFALFDGITFINNGSFLDQINQAEPFSGGTSGCTLINNGTYTKTGTGQSGIGLPFYNNGNLELQNGSMRLTGNGTSNGPINVGSGFLLRIEGNPWDISGPVSGAGTVEFWSPITIRGDYNITGSTVFASNTTIFDTSATIISLNHGQELTISGTAEFNTGDPVSIDSLYLAGHLQGSDSIAILKSMNWARNVVQGSGILNITADATLRLSGGNQQTLIRNLENNGTTIWEAGNFYLSGGITFTNNGTFLDQISQAEPFSGGFSGCTLINNGIYNKTGTGLSQISIPFYNNPNGEIRGIGSMSFSQAYVFTNEGSISPGDPLGSLNLTVDYPTTTTSDLNIEIGGTTEDSLYDQLNINGDATLGGTLNISLVNGFMPVIGDTFVIMIYDSYTGDFSEINGLNTGSGVSFSVVISSTDIKLITIETPNSPPSIFGLLEPDDKVVLSKIDTIKFIWQASNDVDDDELDYTLNIFGSTLDTTIENIADTAFTIVDGQFWEGDTEYQWTVSAGDGIFVTASPDTFSFTTPIIDAINDDNLLVPIVFALEQNYPNPFNPVTHIKYDLPEAAHVRLEVYNILGQLVKVLIDQNKPAGSHVYKFDAAGLSSGMYFYRINAGKYHRVQKMILQR